MNEKNIIKRDILEVGIVFIVLNLINLFFINSVSAFQASIIVCVFMTVVKMALFNKKKESE